MIGDPAAVSDNPLLPYALRYYAHYRNGHLPRAGGICNQNAYLLMLFEGFLRAEGDAQSKQRQDVRAETKRQKALQGMRGR